MPNSTDAQYLYDNKPLFDFYNPEQLVNFHQILSAKNFPGNIKLMEKDGSVTPLNQCTQDQIKEFKIALIQKAHHTNLHPLFIQYITDIFKLYEVKIAISIHKNLSSLLAKKHQDSADKVTMKTNELEILKKNNETRIQEIEKIRAELKNESEKYEFGKYSLMVFTLLAFFLVTGVSSLPAVLILVALGTTGLIGEVICVHKVNKIDNDRSDLYSEEYTLKQPIAKLERELKSENNTLSAISKGNTAKQNKLQELEEEQLSLEEKVSNFNPNQLDSSKISIPALHTEGIFKVDNTTIKLSQTPETDMRMEL